MQRLLTFVAVGVLSAAVAGCGGGDHETHGGKTDAEATRTIEITMKDIAFEPTSVTVQPGETVKFVFRNEGQILHDAFIGDEAAQAEHEKEMREHAGKMDDEHGIKVLPGKTGSLTRTFKAGETLIIGCHETGHYAAGMKITVAVS